MKRKMSWRSLKFIPRGGDESQAIIRKDKGFMALCEQFRYGSSFPDYSIHDTKGMFAKYGHNNVDIDWSDFRKALIKFQLKSPPGKPSVFHGEWFPPEHTINMRKRLLAAVCREYISAQSLAEDLLEWLAKGHEDDAHEFVSAIFARVEWVDSTWTQRRRQPHRRLPTTAFCQESEDKNGESDTLRFGNLVWGILWGLGCRFDTLGVPSSPVSDLETPFGSAGRMVYRIINEVRGVNRVVYDISSKPPATIEWE